MNGEINIALTNQKSKAHQKNQFISLSIFALHGT